MKKRFNRLILLNLILVCGKPVVGRIFTIKVFFENNSKQVRKFTIMIPSKKRLDERYAKY